MIRSIHVIAGFVAITAGLVSFASAKHGRVHAAAGPVYFTSITIATLSAVLIATLDLGALWPFLVAAAGTYAFACAGYVARKRPGRRALVIHVVGLASSFAGLVIAFLVTNFERITHIGGVSFAARLLPLQFVATCIVTWVGVLVYRGRIPRT